MLIADGAEPFFDRMIERLTKNSVSIFAIGGIYDPRSKQLIKQ